VDLFDYIHPPTLLYVKVTANAKSERIKKEITADNTVIYKIYLTQIAENGKANEAVIKLLSKEFLVSKSSISITHGLMCRDKTIMIKRP
jgi:uncharacterized protein